MFHFPFCVQLPAFTFNFQISISIVHFQLSTFSSQPWLFTFHFSFSALSFQLSFSFYLFFNAFIFQRSCFSSFLFFNAFCFSTLFALLLKRFCRAVSVGQRPAAVPFVGDINVANDLARPSLVGVSSCVCVCVCVCVCGVCVCQHTTEHRHTKTNFCSEK